MDKDDEDDLYLVPGIHLHRLLAITLVCLVGEVALACALDHWGHRLGW